MLDCIAMDARTLEVVDGRPDLFTRCLMVFVFAVFLVGSFIHETIEVRWVFHLGLGTDECTMWMRSDHLAT